MADKAVRDEKYMRFKTMSQQQLIESGERDRLVNLLRNRLLECGWRDQVVENCKEVVRQHGVEGITLEKLIQDVTPKARASVPDSVKKELLSRIKNSLSNENF